jgi:hypothetical protein
VKYINMSNFVYFTNFERTEELNDRILNRVIPSHHLDPVLRPRSVPTRYVDMPTTTYKAPEEHSRGFLTPDKVYLSGSSMPFSAYSTVVDVERKIQNKTHPYMKEDLKNTFIPHSESMLYKYSQPPTENIQTHPRLFRNFTGFDKNPNLHGLGNEWFNNPTRQQVKNIGIFKK